MPKFESLVAEYKALWAEAVIRADKAAVVAEASSRLRALKPHYDQVSAAIGAPWYIVGLIHNLESSFSLQKHLHNGDPLTGRTFHEPDGHPRTGSPPFTWVDSAIDALKIKGFQNVTDWSIERICHKLEEYNGWGYRNNFPSVKSPYLWSFTNKYTKGKYVADHQFNPNAVSDQVGAMAVLKQLVADGVAQVVGQAPPPPPPPPVPVPTGLFFADNLPFGLRAEPRQEATKLLQVLPNVTVKKIKEETDPNWWQVEVTAPDNSKHIGFARRDWLKDKFVMSSFSEERFAESCLDAARRYGTNAHFLIALASADSEMSNVAKDGGGFGPLAMTEEEWATYNNVTETGYSDADRFDPLAQAAIGARMAVKLTDELRANLGDKKLATSEELYLARIFSPKCVKALVEGTQSQSARDTLVPSILTAVELDRMAASRSWLNNAMTVQQIRSAVQQRLDQGFVKAVDLILKVEPELTLGPAEASGDAEKLPWMKKAKGELAKNIKEIPGGASNPEVEKYFTDTTLGRQTDDVAWCAAFVSWCIKESGGSQKPVTYSARAADWLQNGEKLPGPQFGAVAVTKPLVPRASGHVGFVVSWDETNVKLLGGNQHDSVCEQEFHLKDVRGWRMM